MDLICGLVALFVGILIMIALLPMLVLYFIFAGIYMLIMLPYYLVKLGHLVHNISYDPATQSLVFSIKF